MNGDIFCWFFRRSFRLSPWMRRFGNALTSKLCSSTSASMLSFSVAISFCCRIGARDNRCSAIARTISVPPTMPTNHRISLRCVPNTDPRMTEMQPAGHGSATMGAVMNSCRLRCVLVVLSALVFLSATPRAQPATADVDALVQRAMTAFEVPGVSLAIVKDGHVLVAKGYGVRKLGEPAMVDAKTRFGIASNTKAFTATALGILVDEGKIRWDAPVIDYLPWFQMSDPYVTRELSVRDLLVHRSGLGLGAGDLLWWPPSTYTRKEVAQRLRYLPLATSFRSAYAYDNVLYIVAGELIEAVSGQPWEDFMSSRVLAK